MSSRRSRATDTVFAPAPQPGRRSASSGLVVHTTRSDSPAAVAEKLLDDVEQEAARPVHVLEHDDHGLRRGEHPDQA